MSSGPFSHTYTFRVTTTMLPRQGERATLLSAAAHKGQGPISYLPQVLMWWGGASLPTHAATWQMSYMDIFLSSSPPTGLPLLCCLGEVQGLLSWELQLEGGGGAGTVLPSALGIDGLCRGGVVSRLFFNLQSILLSARITDFHHHAHPPCFVYIGILTRVE